jgi:eukaryotic-like serine/threonine-protein kinase
MSPERWQIIERLFHEASALDPNERAAYFNRECNNDPSLRTEVESLIAAHEQTGTFIDEPLIAATQDLVVQEEAANLRVGQSLGPYQILGVLGVGGMGEVYRARDTRVPREVAIKILRSVVAKDTQRLKRFKREAWAISALNHPNILTVHEFG